RTGSKRFGERLFTSDTVTAMLRTEFYSAFAPGDDRGTVRYKEKRFRGLHPAAFTYEEWQQIRSITQSMHHAAKRPERGRQTYEFAGYIACIHCGLTLRCQSHGVTGYLYYRDTARSRRLQCSNGGESTIRSDLTTQQFGE